MSPTPTGRRPTTAPGELHLTRTFRAPIEDVWASITEPERTARWFAQVGGRGRAGPGRTVRYRMTLEEGEPEGDLHIEVCEPPRRLVASRDGAALPPFDDYYPARRAYYEGL